MVGEAHHHHHHHPPSFSICTALHDEFVSVSLPRQLVIQNARLGFLFKVLQLAFIVMMVAFCVAGEVWQRPSPAQGYGFSLWSEGPLDDAALQLNAPHCLDSQSYSFNYSSLRSFNPGGCRALTREEASSKAGKGGETFISTFVQDTATWHGKGAACSTSVQQACEGSTLSGVYAASGGSCSCTTHEEYFAQDAEEQRIFLSHGYEVDTSGGQGFHVVRGSSLTHIVQEGPEGQMLERVGDMTTVFQKSDGTSCQVGGKLEWSSADSAHGITGTLRELLACADLTLDSDPRSFLAASGGLAPHFRTMGFSLELRLSYKNSLWSSGVVCYVRVSAIPVWTWKQFVDIVRLPIPSGEQLAKQSRQVFGVTVSMKAAGQFYRFDFVKMISAFASMLVMVQVPRYITQFIALYCLGLMSNIYRNAKRAKLNIFEHFHGACARMMLAEVGFRGLMGGKWRGKVVDMPGLTEDMLFKRLKSVFHEHMIGGILEADELRKMAAVIFAKMDLGKNGVISCSDFISSCTANETIDISSMARFFDDDKKVGFVQQYFDDTDEMRKSYTSEKSDPEDLDIDIDASEDDSVLEGQVALHGVPNRRGSTTSLRRASLVGVQAHSPRVEADEVRQLVAMGLQQVNARLQALEGEELPGRVAELSKKVENATSKAMHACRAVAKKEEEDTTTTVKDAQEVKTKAEVAANQANVITSRVQHLEEEISLLQTHLEARTLQLEEVAMRQVTMDLKHRTEETRKYCDERLRSIEAALQLQNVGRSTPQQPPQLAVGSSVELSPAESQAEIADREGPVPEISRTQGKLAFPAKEEWKTPSASAPHPCFARALIKSPSGTPTASRGSSEPAPARAASSEGAGESLSGWRRVIRLN